MPALSPRDAAAAYGVTVGLDVVPTVTAGSYAANACMGGVIQFPNILPFDAANNAAVLESIALKFKASKQTVGFYVAIFTAAPAGTFTDNVAAAIAAADSLLLVGIYHLTSPQSPLGTHTIYNLDGLGKALDGTSTSLFAVVVPDGATAGLASTTDMILELGMLWG